MTTFTLDGPITEIITAPNVPDFSIGSLAASAAGSPPPTTIEPSGVKYTIVLASVTDSGGRGAQFQMSSSFNIGDVVEIYNDSSPANSFLVLDENGDDISAAAGLDVNGQLIGARYRKVRSGSGRNWGYLPIS